MLNSLQVARENKRYVIIHTIWIIKTMEKVSQGLTIKWWSLFSLGNTFIPRQQNRKRFLSLGRTGLGTWNAALSAHIEVKTKPGSKIQTPTARCAPDRPGGISPGGTFQHKLCKEKIKALFIDPTFNLNEHSFSGTHQKKKFQPCFT